MTKRRRKSRGKEEKIIRRTPRHPRRRNL